MLSFLSFQHKNEINQTIDHKHIYVYAVIKNKKKRREKTNVNANLEAILSKLILLKKSHVKHSNNRTKKKQIILNDSILLL